MLNYSLLPEHLQGGMRRYVENGIMPGHFLTAVLENDLMEAFKRADATCAARMVDIANFLYNELPMNCYGSPTLVKTWARERQLAETCPTCQEIIQKHNGFGPSHDGSKKCESRSIASGGTNAHCSCDMCF